jgi:hypothetical protein
MRELLSHELVQTMQIAHRMLQVRRQHPLHQYRAHAASIVCVGQHKTAACANRWRVRLAAACGRPTLQAAAWSATTLQAADEH